MCFLSASQADQRPQEGDADPDYEKRLVSRICQSGQRLDELLPFEFSCTKRDVMLDVAALRSREHENLREL